MKQLLVLGPGCPRCEQLERNVRKAVEQVAFPCEVQKVSDMRAISGFGVMVTPALVVDGKVECSGKVLSVEEIVELLGDDE